MPNIRNTGTSPIKVDDIRIRPGESVHVTDIKWKRWIANPIAKSLADGRLEVVGAKKQKATEPEANDDDISAAIGAMLGEDPDKENDAWWKANGDPEVAEIGRRVGRKISAKDRNAAWERYLDEHSDTDSE